MRGVDVVHECEDEARMPSNARLGTVVFPNGSLAVLPADSHLQVAVAKASIDLHAAAGTSWSRKAVAQMEFWKQLDKATGGWDYKADARQTGASVHFKFGNTVDVMDTTMLFVTVVNNAPGLLANVCARVLAADDARKAEAQMAVRRHQAEVTADRLTDALDKWPNRFDGRLRDAIGEIRSTLQDIADGIDE